MQQSFCSEGLEQWRSTGAEKKYLATRRTRGNKKVLGSNKIAHTSSGDVSNQTLTVPR